MPLLRVVAYNKGQLVSFKLGLYWSGAYIYLHRDDEADELTSIFSCTICAGRDLFWIPFEKSIYMPIYA
jgi:hypothetical protein